MTVRAATPDDAAAYGAMCLQVLGESEYLLREPDEFDASAEARAAAIERYRACTHSFLRIAVDDDNGDIVGWVAATGNDLRRRRHAADLAVGVLRAHSGKGVARALLESVIAWAPGAGISRLELTVDSRNIAAIALYMKLGFRMEGTLRKVAIVNGVAIDDYQMALLLT